MKGFDEARLALEAMTGGKNTLILDDIGMPSVMVRIPKFKWSDVMEGGEDKTCSAFIVGGKEVDCIYVSKFLNFVEFGRAYSLPGRDPEHMMDFDEARYACARKGRGWHIMSNAEYMALAHWANANGTVPRGNTDYGRSGKRPHETAMLAPQLWPTIPTERRSRTDAGPAGWSHDGTDAGVFDLVGNLWDSVAGLRLMNGEIQVIKDNDSALGVDEGPDSKEWRAITMDGELVDPGTPGTLKFDSAIEGNDIEEPLVIPGGVILGEEIDHPHYTGPDKGGDYGYGFMSFRELIIKGLRPAPAILKELGLAPIGDDIGPSSIFVRNTGERTAYRGGSWYDGPRGGLWELYLRDGRDYTYPDIGFRACYVDLPDDGE